MHLYRQKRGARLWPVLAALTFVAAVLLLILASGWLGRDARAQQTALLEDALQQAVVSCYATEGRYPADLEYLIEHYGVQLDREQYLVIYDIFADNIRPRVRVVWMGED